MSALFGEERATRLRVDLEPMTSAEREATIVNELAKALKEFGHRFVLPFCFKSKTGKRTTHHLILVTKHFKGYEVMKGIMAQASSSEDQGVPSFTFSPAADARQTLLFSLNQPLERLRTMLLEDFAGQTLTMRELYEKHSVDKPYLAKNYKDVLAQLETERVIATSGRKSKRGFADSIVVTFPKRRST